MAGNGNHRKRLRRVIEAFSAIDDPIARLDAVRAAREEIETLEREAVGACRAAGHTWTDIGARYGLTRQGAQQRFRGRHEPPADATPP